ncbi:MAG: phytanoyl-CoA dioxygenase family protein [Deltaproteobacteria bacterium]|nr:phytanoyl-CoA dioxygenase family protein [Deltaproteobacteria bacterium]
MNHPTHALNRGFEWHPIQGPFRRLSEAQAELYNEQGFFVMEDVIPADILERVISEIDPFEEETEAFLQTRKDGKLFIARANEITFTAHLVAKSDTLKNFVSSELFRDIVADVIGPDVRLYWDQAVYKKPGATDPFPWHQDNGYTFIEPQQYLTCWVALTDATRENGCPEVAPRLHREGTFEHELTDLGFRCLPDEHEGQAAPARAGSIVVFSSLTPHRTGPNRSDQIRKAYIVQFAPDGACIVARDDRDEASHTPATAEDRQFPILVGGQPPSAARN